MERMLHISTFEAMNSTEFEQEYQRLDERYQALKIEQQTLQKEVPQLLAAALLKEIPFDEVEPKRIRLDDVNAAVIGYEIRLPILQKAREQLRNGSETA